MRTVVLTVEGHPHNSQSLDDELLARVAALAELLMTEGLAQRIEVVDLHA